MKNIHNGGLELAILSAIEKDRQLTDQEYQTKRFLESLPISRTEFKIGDIQYYYDRENKLLFLKPADTMTLKQVPGNPVVIQRSIKNASGGWIHLDIFGNSHWDLYEEHKSQYLFILGSPY